MNCKEVSEHIELFVLGDLEQSEQDAMRAHFYKCPRCRQAESQCRMLVTTVRRDAPKQPPAPEFVTSLQAAIDEEIGARTKFVSVRRVFITAASIAACVLFAFILWHVTVESDFAGDVTSAENNSMASVVRIIDDRIARSVPAAIGNEVVIQGQNMYVLLEEGRASHIASVDMTTGKRKWQCDFDSFGYISADRSQVYCLAPAENSQIRLIAIDGATGNILWQYSQPEPPLFQKPAQPVLLGDGRICWSNNATVHLLETSNGEVLWSNYINDNGLLSPATVSKGNLYIAGSAAVYCFDIKTGNKNWQIGYDLKMCEMTRPLVLADDGHVYVAARSDVGQGLLCCIELSKQTIAWTTNVPHVAHLYAAGNKLFLRGQDIIALDRSTGQISWMFSATGCSPVTYDNGLVYFVDSNNDGSLVVLNGDTGKKVWEMEDLRSCNALIMAGNRGYLKTYDGVIHVIALKG